MDPRLYQALKKGDIQYLKIAMHERPSWRHGLTAQGNTPLHIAASQDYNRPIPEFLEIFESYLFYQFRVNSRGDYPLHCATRAGRNFMANFLIGSAKRSYTVLHLHQMQNKYGDTPLHEAARNCHFGIAFELMKADRLLGEVVNNHGESALYLAAERGAVEIVRMLLQAPSCAVGGPNGQTALHAAVCQNYGNMYQSLSLFIRSTQYMLAPGS